MGGIAKGIGNIIGSVTGATQGLGFLAGLF
jgi:hypothetical protein